MLRENISKNKLLENELRAELAKVGFWDFAVNDADRFPGFLPTDKEKRAKVEEQTKKLQHKLKLQPDQTGNMAVPMVWTLAAVEMTATQTLKQKHKFGVCHVFAQLGFIKSLEWLEKQKDLTWTLRIVSSAPKDKPKNAHTFAILDINDTQYAIDPWATAMKQDKSHGLYRVANCYDTDPLLFPCFGYLNTEKCNIQTPFTYTCTDKDGSNNETATVKPLPNPKNVKNLLDISYSGNFLKSLAMEVNDPYWDNAGSGLFGRKLPQGIAKLREVFFVTVQVGEEEYAMSKVKKILAGRTGSNADVDDFYKMCLMKAYKVDFEHKLKFLIVLNKVLNESRINGIGFFCNKEADGIERLKKARDKINFASFSDDVVKSIVENPDEDNVIKVGMVYDEVVKILEEKQAPLSITIPYLRKRSGDDAYLYNYFYEEATKKSVTVRPLPTKNSMNS